MSETNKKDDVDTSRIARLFDIRLILGGLLSLYGLILLVAGFVDMRPHKSPGMHLNLWTGLGMLVLGLIMLAWMRARPLAPPDPESLKQTDAGPQSSRAS
jgi:hypothetical protein